MKKSLKVIATATLAFSMFASVAMAAETAATPTAVTTAAAVKTSKDFTDLAGKDAALLAKIDALLAKGFMDGKSDTAFDIEGNMTRAEAAKLVAKIFNLTVGTETTSSFKDVDGTDASQAWAIPFIEAAKKAGIIDGMTDTTFAPKDNVTLGQLATLLVKGFGKAADVKTTTPWYQGYLDVAKAAGIDLGTDGAKLATRGDLVVGSFAADAAFQSLTKASVTEAKATGVYKVQVTFNKAVDTAVAKLALTKGTLAVSTSTTAPVWSDDKKSVTLTTDTRINEGDYTVTLSGLAADAVDKTTATFKATDETVTKIDFVNASDTVAYSKVATIKLKATNQYNEAVSLGTSSFTALVSGQTPTSFKKDADGNLVITANVSGTAGVTQGNGIIPVTVYLNNSNVTVSKNFKVGTVPILSKIEAGKVTYSNKGTKLSAKDETASIALSLIDQYGNAIVKSQLQPVDHDSDPSTAPVAEISATTINPVITPYEQKLAVVRTNNDYTDFFDDNDDARIKIQLAEKLDKSADYTVNIYGGSSSATATVSVGAANLATKFEFDASAVVVAAGDATTIIPLIATDANGNKLGAQDIVDQASRFNITASNTSSAVIIPTGSDKGKVKLTYTPSSPNTVGSKVYVSGTINQSQTNTFVQTSIPVSDARIPERITVTTEPTAKAILGADSEIVYKLKDQYGKDLGNIPATIPSANGQTSKYRVKVTVTSEGGAGITFKQATPVAPAAALPTAYSDTTTNGVNEKVYYFNNDQLAYFNAGFNLTTEETVGKVTVKSVVEKAPNGTNNFSDYTSATTRTLESIKSDTALTYSLNTVGSLFAAKDKFASNAAVVGTGAGQAGDLLVAGNSRFDKKLSVVAKDSAGNTVKLPLNYVRGISASDPNVLIVNTDTTGGVQDGYVLGNKAGTATVSAIVYTNKGQTINLTQELTVKADTIVVDTISADNTTATYAAGNTFAYKYFNNLKVVDNYGIEYKTDAANNVDPIAQYFAVLGVQYTVQTTGGTGSVTINSATGQITNVDTSVTEFLITAIAPNGKSLTMLVSK